MLTDTELHNPLDPDRLTLELFNPFDYGSYQKNVVTINRAIETVRTGEQDVLLVYPHDTMSTRYIHRLTRRLAEDRESHTDFHISTMTRQMFDALTHKETA